MMALFAFNVIMQSLHQKSVETVALLVN